MTLPPRLGHNSLNEYLLCFVHIPKTAGSSFTNVLITLIGQDKFRVLLPDILQGFKKVDFDINSYNGISGHFPYEISKLISKPILLLTFLRDPVSRSLSHYKQLQRMNLDDPWIHKSKNYRFYKQLHQMSFSDFIEHPFFRIEVANLQTRMLGLLIEHPIRQLRDVMPMDKSSDRSFSVELAKERLEEFSFLGLQEKFRESMELFSYQFGTYPIMNPPTVNISSDKIQFTTLSESVIEKLFLLNKLDFELYEFGQKLFTNRYDEMLGALRKEYKYREVKNTHLHELLSIEFYKNNEIMDFPYRYEFDEIYERSGWYLVEQVNEKIWAWSGPGTTSTIDLPFSRANYLRIRFQIMHFIEPDVLESLELHIDDQRIHLIHTQENGVHIFAGIIPCDPEKKYTCTKLSFHVNRTAYPPDMSTDSPGARLLGIALSWIEISLIK